MDISSQAVIVLNDISTTELNIISKLDKTTLDQLNFLYVKPRTPAYSGLMLLEPVINSHLIDTTQELFNKLMSKFSITNDKLWVSNGSIRQQALELCYKLSIQSAFIPHSIYKKVKRPPFIKNKRYQSIKLCRLSKVACVSTQVNYAKSYATC